jgi:hypothetical protein
MAAPTKPATLSRSTIRRRFEERFTARRMAHEYLVVYRTLSEFEAAPSSAAVARASFC